MTEPGTKVIVKRVSVPIPVASFMANRTSGNAPLAVKFFDTSKNYPTSWNWNFGDGQWFNTTVALEKNPIYLYTVPGTYRVQLTAENAGGVNVTSLGTTITVRA